MDYVAAFRAAAARRGIDPAAGSTSFQAVGVRAELSKAARNVTEWWRDATLWADDGESRSSTEYVALHNVIAECKGLPRAETATQIETMRMHEVIDALKQANDHLWVIDEANKVIRTPHEMTLREVMARQRA